MNDPDTMPGPDVSAPRYWNPYVAGFGLGLTLLLSFVLLGVGLGASGANARLAAVTAHALAPEAVETNGYLAPWFAEGSPLRHYLVFMTIGTLLGGFVSAAFAGRLRPGVERGAGFPVGSRLLLAVFGGVLVGFASRMAGGCTSGQALTGGALLLPGSWAFLGAVFFAGFVVAPLVRKEWHA